MNKKLHFKENTKLFSFILLMFIGLSLFNTPSQANSNKTAISQLDTKTVTLKISNGSIKSILIEIQKQTKLSFVYKDEILKSLGSKSIAAKNEAVESVLRRLFEGTNLTFSSKDNIITITQKAIHTPQSNQTIQVKGRIIDEDKNSIPGATVISSNGLKGAITDENGNFIVQVNVGDELEVSFVGYKTLNYKVTDKSSSVILKMENNVMGVDDVIVTGIYSRKKESFTGSASTYTQKDLKLVGSTNLLQSLKTLDPTFVMLDSKEFGSNPNKMPNIEVRGTTSIAGLRTEFGEDPNRPLFILDGVECRLDDVMNLNMDRVKSMTVLKDAASTAIYGSKAANGVIVIETLQPQPGKLRLSYNGNFSIDTPDLSDYNLMNSVEKLEFERVAGIYKSDNFNTQLVLNDEYFGKLKEIRRGVDTYWLSEPLRTVFNNTHNITIDGGEGAMRYSIGVNYNGKNGVMKGSNRNIVGADMVLSYRTSKLIFTNRFSTTITDAENEPISFYEYAKQNPYYRKTTESGVPQKYLFYEEGNDYFILNPLYLTNYKNDNIDHENSYRNTFSIEYKVLKELMIKGRFSVSSVMGKNNQFKSPNHPDFDKTDPLKKGSFSTKTTNSFNYDGDLSITYGKLFNKVHMVNIVGGWNFNDRSSTYEGYNVVGFASDYHKNPQYSAGFTEGQKPNYSENRARATSFFANGNYSFKNRYLFDANIRMDGTSRFGSNNLFSKTWAFGVAWNLHNEEFIKKLNFFSNLKIRSSIGNPGNQNFDAYIAYKTYAYNNTSYQNMFGTGATIGSFGNKNLKWQRTLDKNIGMDFAMFENRINGSIEYYNKKTDPLLIGITVPSSSGATTLQSNLGGQKATGMSGSINYFFVKRKDFNWNVNFNFRYGSVRYFGIGRTLDKLNSNAQSQTDKNQDNYKLQTLYDSGVLRRYYDGAEVNSLYAVPSLGIDPATGREVFLDINGEHTFQYKQSNERLVGNARPDVEGILGTNLFYKGFSFNISLRYSLGANQMASALYEKVENISSEQLKFNQDKRALYDRWQKPGDKAKFTSIANVGSDLIIPMSSRFVVEENYLSFESISVGYETNAKWLKKIGVQGANITSYLSNIGRITSLKEERGINYPFARTVTFSIGLRF